MAVQPKDGFGEPKSPQREQAHSSNDDTSRESPSAQKSLEKPTQSPDTSESPLSQTQPAEPTPVPASRPPHSGWEPTTINMAKCDYCDKRRRGTLHRCVQCQIAICKTCYDSGILDHDSRHTLDANAISWDIHPKEKPDKRAKRPGVAASRAISRGKSRSIRPKKAELSRAKTSAVEATSPVDRQDEIVVATESAANQEEQRNRAQTSFAGFVPRWPPSGQGDDGLQLADSGVQQMHNVSHQSSSPQLISSQRQVYNQPHSRSPESQQPPLTRSQFANPPMVTQPISQAMPMPHQGVAWNTPPHVSPRPQLIQGRPNQYRPENPNASSQQLHANQVHEEPDCSGSYETYLANRNKVFRHHPYRHPSLQENHGSGHEYHALRPLVEQREAFRGVHGYSIPPTTSSGPEHIFNQGRSRPGCGVDPRVRTHVFPWNHQNTSHHSVWRNNIVLPPIRELEQPPRPPQPCNIYPQPVPVEPLINRIGGQLESDTLATRQDFPSWPLDECLRHEISRLWSRRNVHSSPLQELRHPGGPVEVNAGDAFRTLLGATYFAGIRLRLETQNAARQWLVDTEKQLCSDGLMDPIADYQFEHVP